MSNNTAFFPLDLQNWPRAQMFYYFSKIAPTGYSLTVKIDITIMRNTLKERKIKFFPAYLWLVTKILNKQTEFKVAKKDDTLGYWDTLTPLYAAFHDDTKTISFMWTEYSDSFADFYLAYLENQERYKNNHGILSSQDQTPPPNCYTVSCLPWINFDHFSVHNYDNKEYYFPSIEAGKFIEQENSILMPLSITAHHATTDGWHIKKFLQELQETMNYPDEWL